MGDPFFEQEFLERMARAFVGDPHPFIVLVWPDLEQFDKALYDHVYAKVEEIQQLMPGAKQPLVMGLAPIGPPLEDEPQIE